MCMYKSHIQASSCKHSCHHSNFSKHKRKSGQPFKMCYTLILAGKLIHAEQISTPTVTNLRTHTVDTHTHDSTNLFAHNKNKLYTHSRISLSTHTIELILNPKP